MNEIRRTDEHWKDNLLGLTFDKRLEQAILQRHCMEIGIERAEMRAKQLREQLKKLDGQPLKKYLLLGPLKPLANALWLL